MTADPPRTTLFVDADACPVKEECYRVAARCGLPVFVVANSYIRTPNQPGVAFVQVEAGADAADDWIAERCGPGDVVITSDIPLADRALKAGAQAVSSKGEPFTENSIGSALAVRGIMEQIRSTGEITGGPRPFAPADRSRFLQALDLAVTRARRAKR